MAKVYFSIWIGPYENLRIFVHQTQICNLFVFCTIKKKTCSKNSSPQKVGKSAPGCKTIFLNRNDFFFFFNNLIILKKKLYFKVYEVAGSKFLSFLIYLVIVYLKSEEKPLFSWKFISFKLLILTMIFGFRGIRNRYSHFSVSC